MNKPTILFLSIAVGFLFSCKKSEPAKVFMPDMYYAVAYDPYQEAVLAYSDHETTIPIFEENQGATRLKPVANTIARNQDHVLPVAFTNTSEGYELAKKVKTSPLNPAKRDKDIARGKQLFEQACAACHGTLGDGNGSIVASGAYSGVPDYKDRDISVGSVHHVIIHGRNAMGSYAGQLNVGDRWRVAMYVMSEFKSK